MRTSKATVAAIGTGGTIAGQLRPDQAGYDPAVHGIGAVVEADPLVRSFAPNLQLDTLQDPNAVSETNPQGYVNVASSLLTPSHLLLLTAQCRQKLKNPNVSGLVVTSGTDAQSTILVWLQMTVPEAREKPLVVVGAARPTFIEVPNRGGTPEIQLNPDADGPANLMAAVAAAIDPEAKGRGVLHAMQGVVSSGFDVTKLGGTPLRGPITPTFSQGSFAALGRVQASLPRIVWSERVRLPEMLTFHVSTKGVSEQDLPRVETVADGVPRATAPASLDFSYRELGIKAYVVSGSGDGSMSAGLQEWAKANDADKDLVLLRAGRPEQASPQIKNAFWPGTLGASWMGPEQAHVFLQLALLHIRRDPESVPGEGLRAKVAHLLERYTPVAQ
ncbi:MAG: asparaginase domain-containing protein [Myxococcota bacterium]